MVSPKEVINELIVDVFNQILSIESDVLKERGVKLSMTEVHVLEAIKNTEDPTMGNVANKLRITMGTLTTSVNVLVKKEYVNRYRDEKDRRKVYLELNDQAKEVLAIHDEFHEEMVSSLLKDLNLEKDKILLKSLENISNYFKQRY
ncbi:MarR family winged helix-turn-helix transcriptional regulator [Mariniplasma anaerobium]|uniref:HTH-type transcriptional regulator SarZ n=1 Tax=Mariniplasma anaerobium TaxID=2735436 RepID=A0A7U9TID9_9MOLU|nr:MarR family winged helix-turn-helix transcriptional regulator [Mariniplasma anaerobium]BCR35325.1 MarR family transcriptional regulator [Mariniplasma anaerobium]